MAAAEPTCPRHPDRVAYVRCQRCERPVCPDCQVPAPVGVLCVDCVRQAKSEARPMRSRLGFQAAAGPAYLTYALIAANVAVFLYQLGVGWLRVWGDWSLIPGVATEWYRWITAGFVHADWLHIGMNMFVLWQFGTMLERVLGRWLFAALYLAGLIGSSLAIVLLGTEGIAHGGASGAIFGLIAAYAVIGVRLKLDINSLLATAGTWLVLGFFVSGVSWQGHLGGAIAGALVMLAALRWVEKRQGRVR